MRANGELAPYVMADRLREAEAYRLARLAKPTKRRHETTASGAGRLRAMASALGAALRPARRAPARAVRVVSPAM